MYKIALFLQVRPPVRAHSHPTVNVIFIVTKIKMRKTKDTTE